MVKVQKLKPIFNKKDIPENPKKNPFKKNNVDSLKEKVKKSDKALKTAVKIEVAKNVKQINDDRGKKSKEVQEKLKEIVPKKTQQLKGTIKKNVTNKKPAVPELKGIDEKKKFVGGKVEKKTLLTAKSEKKKQLGAKIVNKNKKENLKAGTEEAATTMFEPVDFDEEKFKDIVKLGNIKKISNALKVLVEKEVSEKKASIFTDYRYFLYVACYKIPNCPKRMVKLNLKHSLVDIKADDVVFIVPDLQRGAKVDYEPTIQHYEDLLRELDMGAIKILPFNQLRQECTSYEAKRKLANSYEYFLCDGRIVGHVSAFCGKHFQKPRTTLHAVRMNNPKTYKSELDHALKRTSYKQLHKGDLSAIPVGNDRFTINQLSENIEGVIQQLKTLFPGGYANIRSIHIKIDIKGTSSLPLYVNLSGAPAEVPNVIGPREQRMIQLKKDANNILSKFSLSKTGEFVKLNKEQIEHRQKMRDARTAILSKENDETEENNSELNTTLEKKVKNKKQMDDAENEDGSEYSNQEESEISDEE